MNPSKTSDQENFPVGSFLIRRRLRGIVAAYYAFARAADDIADCPRRAPREKIAELEHFRQILYGRAEGGSEHPATRLRPILRRRGIPLRRAGDLLIAFERDAVKSRYRDWAELLDYCRYSAAPVGRFLLDLHGQSRRAYPACDHLCSALQILNHLQDCATDYQRLDRIYLPANWMREASVSEAQLAQNQAGAGMRRLLDRILDATAGLMERANALPGLLESRRIAMESATICHIAWGLIRRLGRRDPLAERVVLSRVDILRCFLRGMNDGWRRRPLQAGAGS